MTSSSVASKSVIIGVDTHKDNHVAVAINELGIRLADCSVPVTLAGYQQLLDWSRTFGSVVTFGIEGTGSYGRGLTSFLLREGFSVLEVCRPARSPAGQCASKDDVIDAEKAARQVLSGQATATPKNADGQVEMMRVIKVAKDSAIKAQAQVLISLKALLVTADEALRAHLESLSTPNLVAACTELATGALETPATAMEYALANMARRWQYLQKEIETHWEHLKVLTRQTAPALVQAYGIGPDTAAQMLITFGDRGNRIRSEAGFAKMCGACPIPASSGKTQRHRLNRGGNRQANAALFRVVIVRMRWHKPTKDYVARRTAQGLSKREIIRCLKRYVAREVYHLVNQAFSTKKVNVVAP